MAHFAELDDTNTVLRVIVVSDTDAPDPAPNHSEPLGQAFIASLGLDGRWVQTSYNAKFRRRYAGVGMLYLQEHDVFVLAKPYPSWTLNLDDPEDWVAPIPIPQKNEEYKFVWNEDAQTWDEFKVPQKPEVVVLEEQ